MWRKCGGKVGYLRRGETVAKKLVSALSRAKGVAAE
jgi:hypothetical protein